VAVGRSGVGLVGRIGGTHGTPLALQTSIRSTGLNSGESVPTPTNATYHASRKRAKRCRVSR
jgi:hypothetical protein